MVLTPRPCSFQNLSARWRGINEQNPTRAEALQCLGRLLVTGKHKAKHEVFQVPSPGEDPWESLGMNWRGPWDLGVFHTGIQSRRGRRLCQKPGSVCSSEFRGWHRDSWGENALE